MAKKKKIKRIDDMKDDLQTESIQSDSLKVKTKIVINDGIVMVVPINNPFDENKS